MKFLTIFFTYFTLTCALSASAQSAAFKYSNAALKKGSIEAQFQQLNYISRTSGDYKLIRKENLDIIKANVQDSIRGYQQKISSLTSSAGSHTATTKALQDSVTSLKQQVEIETAKIGSFTFLGISMDKSIYNTIVWGLIGVFFTMSIIGLSLYKKAKTDTLEYQLTAEKTQEEFQVLRKKSLEKEQALRRQLQDELNRKEG